MTTGQRHERDLPLILDELAASPYPDYIDSVLTTTARRRQRPTWTFPERWLPMATLTSRAATIPRTPLRVVAILALLLLALAVGAALIIGSRHQVPTPFGPAANGHVAFAAGGDIFTVDPVTGTSTAIVAGPETDINPRWSRDGTHLAFERKVVGDSGPGLVYIARGDGSNLFRVETPAPIAEIGSYDFSPDGTELLIEYGGEYPQVLIVATDGSGFRDLGLATPAGSAAWRPPDGSEILLMGVQREGEDGCCAIQAVNATTGDARTILGVEPGRFRGHPRWSPDGSLISFGEWGDGDPDNGGLTVQTHIIAADGTGERLLPSPPGIDMAGARELVERRHPPARHSRRRRHQRWGAAGGHPGGRSGHGRRDRLAELGDVAHGPAGLGVGTGRFVDPGNAERERRLPRAGAAGPRRRHLPDTALDQRQPAFLATHRSLTRGARQRKAGRSVRTARLRRLSRFTLRRPPPCR